MNQSLDPRILAELDFLHVSVGLVVSKCEGAAQAALLTVPVRSTSIVAA
jgi:hypothetical protein